MTGDCHAGICGSRGLQCPRRPDSHRGESESGAAAATSACPITQCWPRSDRQRCSVHCARNLYSKLPERERERVKLAYWRVLDDTIDEADAKEKLQAPVDKPALSALACRPPRSRCVPPDGRQFPGLGLRRLAPVREWAPCCALRGHGAERLRTSWMRWTNGRPPTRARIISV